MYWSPTIFLSSSKTSWMNSLPFACWQEVWTCRFFELKQRSYEAHSVEKSAKKCKKKFREIKFQMGYNLQPQLLKHTFQISLFFPLLPHCARCSNANCISGRATHTVTKFSNKKILLYDLYHYNVAKNDNLMEFIIQSYSKISFLYHSFTECANKYKQGDHNFFSYPKS